MAWLDSKHATRRCFCGVDITNTHLARHNAGIWHKMHKELIALRKRGLTYAEIARQIRSSRMYVRHMFRKAKLLSEE